MMNIKQTIKRQQKFTFDLLNFPNTVTLSDLQRSL